jgi:hypothetical protein
MGKDCPHERIKGCEQLIGLVIAARAVEAKELNPARWSDRRDCEHRTISPDPKGFQYERVSARKQAHTVALMLKEACSLRVRISIKGRFFDASHCLNSGKSSDYFTINSVAKPNRRTIRDQWESCCLRQCLIVIYNETRVERMPQKRNRRKYLKSNSSVILELLRRLHSFLSEACDQPAQYSHATTNLVDGDAKNF